MSPWEVVRPRPGRNRGPCPHRLVRAGPSHLSPRWLPLGAAALDLPRLAFSRACLISSGPCLAPVGAAQPVGYRVGGGLSEFGANSGCRQWCVPPQRGQEGGEHAVPAQVSWFKRLQPLCWEAVPARFRDGETEAHGANAGLGFNACVLLGPGVGLCLAGPVKHLDVTAILLRSF